MKAILVITAFYVGGNSQTTAISVPDVQACSLLMTKYDEGRELQNREAGRGWVYMACLPLPKED